MCESRKGSVREGDERRKASTFAICDILKCDASVFNPCCWWLRTKQRKYREARFLRLMHSAS